MRSAARALLAAVVVAQVVAPHAQGRRPDADARAVLGRVIDAGSGAPVRGARVTIAAGNGPVVTLLTDSRGVFVSEASDGSTIRASKAGWVTRAVPLPPSTGRAPARPFDLALSRAGAIAGRVYDTAGHPAPGVRVAVWRTVPGVTRSPAPDATVETDDRGEYRMGGLAPGAYSVRVIGRPLTGTTVPALGGGASPRQVGVGPAASPPGRDHPAEVRGGETITIDHDPVAAAPAGAFIVGARDGQVAAAGVARVMTVATTAAPTAVVTGTVVDEYGDPVEGARVELRPVGSAGGRKTLAGAIAGRVTDDTGTYRLFAIPAGTYYLAALPPSDLPASALAPPGVSAARPGDPRRTGAFAPVFYPGTATLSAAVPLTVAGGTELSALHLTLALVPAMRIRGVVLDSTGRPGLSGAVSLAVHLPSGVLGYDGHEATIDAEGRFELPNLSPGDYLLQALGKGSTGERELGFEPVSLAGSDLAGVLISTSAGTRVTGRVSYPDTASPGAKLGLGIAPADPAYSAMLSVYSGGFVEADRTFEIRGLVGPGRFVLEGAPAGWWLRAVGVDGVDVTDSPLTFGLRDYANVQVVLEPAGGSIEGRLDLAEPGSRLDDANALAGIGHSVVVFPLDSRLWFYRSRHLRLATAGRDDRFRVSGLPPGDYWVVATRLARGAEQAYGVWQDAEMLGRLVSGARPVRVGPEAVVQVALRPFTPG